MLLKLIVIGGKNRLAEILQAANYNNIDHNQREITLALKTEAIVSNIYWKKFVYILKIMKEKKLWMFKIIETISKTSFYALNYINANEIPPDHGFAWG